MHPPCYDGALGNAITVVEIVVTRTCHNAHPQGELVLLGSSDAILGDYEATIKSALPVCGSDALTMGAGGCHPYWRHVVGRSVELREAHEIQGKLACS
jgi:hypothetical protein